MDVREKLIDSKPCPFCGGEACVKTSTTQTIPSPQWRGYIAKNARAHQQVLMIIKKTALFCLMQSKLGTAAPERRSSMRLIDADEMAVNESEAYMSAQMKIDSPVTLGINSVVHRKIQQLIADTPTIDAVPVTRCKDCKHCNISLILPAGRKMYNCMEGSHDHQMLLNPNDFCSHGERRYEK